MKKMKTVVAVTLALTLVTPLLGGSAASASTSVASAKAANDRILDKVAKGVLTQWASAVVRDTEAAWAMKGVAGRPGATDIAAAAYARSTGLRITMLMGGVVAHSTIRPNVSISVRVIRGKIVVK